MRANVAIEAEAANAPTWALPEQTPGDTAPTWQVVDLALRSIAKARAGLDAGEARWLREAEALKIWEAARDGLRARLHGAPAGIRAPNGAGQVASRPCAWRAAAHDDRPASGRAGLQRDPRADARRDPGDRGSLGRRSAGQEHAADRDPRDPAARTHVVRFELSAETFAMLRQARQSLDDEHGTSLSEDQAMAALCSTAIDGPVGSAGDSTSQTTALPATGRAKFQIAITVCERREQGWQHGAGAMIAINHAAVERAMCDAQHIGSLDGDAPERAYQERRLTRTRPLTDH
jgi:hypothetical protein